MTGTRRENLAVATAKAAALKLKSLALNGRSRPRTRGQWFVIGLVMVDLHVYHVIRHLVMKVWLTVILLQTMRQQDLMWFPVTKVS